MERFFNQVRFVSRASRAVHLFGIAVLFAGMAQGFVLWSSLFWTLPPSLPFLWVSPVVFGLLAAGLALKPPLSSTLLPPALRDLDQALQTRSLFLTLWGQIHEQSFHPFTPLLQKEGERLQASAQEFLRRAFPWARSLAVVLFFVFLFLSPVLLHSWLGGFFRENKRVEGGIIPPGFFRAEESSLGLSEKGTQAMSGEIRQLLQEVEISSHLSDQEKVALRHRLLNSADSLSSRPSLVAREGQGMQPSSPVPLPSTLTPNTASSPERGSSKGSGQGQGSSLVLAPQALVNLFQNVSPAFLRALAQRDNHSLLTLSVLARQRRAWLARWPDQPAKKDPRDQALLNSLHTALEKKQYKSAIKILSTLDWLASVPPPARENTSSTQAEGKEQGTAEGTPPYQAEIKAYVKPLNLIQYESLKQRYFTLELTGEK